MRDAIFEIARRARPGATVASESETLASYYAQRAGRSDLNCVFVSDASALQQLQENDFVIDARGRRYFSNERVLMALSQSGPPTFSVWLGHVPSATVYQLNQKSLDAIVTAARSMTPLTERLDLSPPRSGTAPAIQ